jgi:MFS family permease
VWRGWAKPRNAEAYEGHFRNNVLPHLTEIAGYRGARLLRRTQGQEESFIAITFFESLEAIRAFAGTDIEKAVIEPEARRVLSRVEDRSEQDQLIAARVVQGVGGALLTPQTLTMISAIFPPERRGAAMGVWSGVVGLGSAAGPTLGGLLIRYADWRAIFYLNVPSGIVALAGALLIGPDHRPACSHRLDLVGAVLATMGLFLVVFALVEGSAVIRARQLLHFLDRCRVTR